MRKFISLALSTALAAMMLGVLPGAAAAAVNEPCGANGNFDSRMGGLAQGYTLPATTVEATLDAQTLTRCSGSDSDGKNGSFVFVELGHPSYSDLYPFYDQGSSANYGAYVRLGYGLCSWSGDTFCGNGHQYFIAWSRNAALGSCTTSDANGLTLISGFSTGTHTFKLARQADGSVKAYIDGALVYTLAASATSCWNGLSAVQALAETASWDPGDAQGGIPTNYLYVNNLKGNGVTAANTVYATSNLDFRAVDSGSDDFGIWTIDPR